MTQSTLSETFIKKSNEFYDLIREDFGDAEYTAISINKILVDGDQALTEIQALGLATIKKAAERQTLYYAQRTWVGQAISNYVHIAGETCKTVQRFERIAEIWTELSSGELSAADTANEILRVLAPKLKLDHF